MVPVNPFDPKIVTLNRETTGYGGTPMLLLRNTHLKGPFSPSMTFTVPVTPCIGWGFNKDWFPLKEAHNYETVEYCSLFTLSRILLHIAKWVCLNTMHPKNPRQFYRVESPKKKRLFRWRRCFFRPDMQKSNSPWKIHAHNMHKVGRPLDG